MGKAGEGTAQAGRSCHASASLEIMPIIAGIARFPPWLFRIITFLKQNSCFIFQADASPCQGQCRATRPSVVPQSSLALTAMVFSHGAVLWFGLLMDVQNTHP